jgi:hypothetical protein
MAAMPDPSWVFYHAFYHQIAHWAAFIATLGLLTMIGIAVSTASRLDGIRRLFCQLAIGMTLLGSWWFLGRMHTYSSIVNEMLPSSYIMRLSSVGASPVTFVFAGITTLVLGGLSSAVLWWPRPKINASK